MKQQLEDAGFAVTLACAGNHEISPQQTQIASMIAEPCDLLVIAAIDGASLTTVPEEAEKREGPFNMEFFIVEPSPCFFIYYDPVLSVFQLYFEQRPIGASFRPD